MNILTLELLSEIKRNFRLNWKGTHGVAHFHRVYENGMKLAEQQGVDAEVVQLFSVFHDSQRKNEHWDRHHGKRGAEFAGRLRHLISLDDQQFELLTIACSLHTSTLNQNNITVQACFDADRLDLGRVGKYPNPKYLCTQMAKQKEIIEWAYYRSCDIQTLPAKPFGLSGYLDGLIKNR